MISPAELLASIGSTHKPTEQQQAIIAAAPDRPAVVIAGAGSGKTTTMSDRVLWLIANGFAEPHQVLGLTFTRKAAASLDAQIQRGLAALRASGVVGIADGEPTVLTYHSYGQRVMQEHSMRLGIEPPNRIMRDAAIWQLTERIVSRYQGNMTGIDLSLNGVINAVNALSDQLSEHNISADEVRAFTEKQLSHLENLPGKQTQSLGDAIQVQRDRLLLLPIAEEVVKARLDSSELSFGDQMTWAARLAERVPEVSEWERSRHAFVLLDEYQDTSQSQLSLMRSLFGAGHAVMAVGDPMQAIYEWRGASTGTIESFPADFPARDGTPADRYLLTTSWRNDADILTVANHFADGLTQRGLTVHPLNPRRNATAGVVHLGLYNDLTDEAAAIAEWLAQRWRAGEEGESCAVLVRARAQIEPIERALIERGLPVEVVGVAGLLATPEVIELRSMLQIVCEPHAGPAIMRVLTGARWRLGAKDLAALHRFAGSLTRAVREKNPDAEETTVIEALDQIERAPHEFFTSVGRDRLKSLAAEVRHLRRRAGLPLPDLVIETARVIGLDIEIAALPAGRARRAQAHVDSFVDQAAEFASMGGGLISFLAWLAAAERHERGLSLEGIEPSSDAIQILTIHTAKGLEWDTVVVPGLCEDAFPKSGRGRENWLERVDVVPFPLRGDHDRLPAFTTPQDMKEFSSSLKGFKASCDDRGRVEEERLAYVALTRPRHALMLTASWWTAGVKSRGPSEIFTAARDIMPSAVVTDTPPPDDSRRESEPVKVLWPIDPLGLRREVMQARALAVAQASGTVKSALGTQWLEEAQLLLAERERNENSVLLPSRLSVSALVQIQADPEQLARRLRRPMPFKPDPLARRGTAFHRWLEERFQAQVLFDLDDYADEPDLGDLAMLQERWLASEWAARSPHEIEVPFDHVLDGVLIRGRMDAVYAVGDRWEIVDWKTGPPKTGRDAEAAGVQLAMYRVAWSRIVQVPVDRVSAAFHHVAHNVTVRPSDLLDEEGLIALIRAVAP